MQPAGFSDLRWYEVLPNQSSDTWKHQNLKKKLNSGIPSFNLGNPHHMQPNFFSGLLLQHFEASCTTFLCAPVEPLNPVSESVRF
jgi:hypothetical protein